MGPSLTRRIAVRPAPAEMTPSEFLQELWAEMSKSEFFPEAMADLGWVKTSTGGYVFKGTESGIRQGEQPMASAPQDDDDGLDESAGAEDDDENWETDNGAEDGDNSENDDGSEEDDGSEDDESFDGDYDPADEDDSEDDDYWDDDLLDLLSRTEGECRCTTARSGICRLHREYIKRYVRGAEDEMEYGSGVFPSGCGYPELEGLGYEYNYS